MPIIIGRFQNKTDLVPGLDKFTGSQSEVTKERDCTVLSSFQAEARTMLK